MEAELEWHGETIDGLVFEPADIELDRKFDSGHGLPEGVPFLAWSATRVYFCTEYDGCEGISSLPREPHLVKAEDVRHVS